MPVNRAYLRVTAHTLAAACAIACGGRASLSAIAVDSDGGGAPRGDTSADAAADAELPDGAGYLPDLGPQSAAYQINAAHTGSTDDASLFGAPSRRWAHDFGGPVAFPLIAHGKVIATFITGERPADKRVSVQAFDAVGCEGLARVDFFVLPGDRVVVNEINTMPGFTPTSMYPRMWAASGVDYPALVDRLIRLALQRDTGLR